MPIEKQDPVCGGSKDHKVASDEHGELFVRYFEGREGRVSVVNLHGFLAASRPLGNSTARAWSWLLGGHPHRGRWFAS